jgi:hypothetical protein
MANVQSPKQTPKYSNKRREVIAAADVSIQQVQVVGSDGQIRTLLVWKCGPDVFFADSLNGFFDPTGRKVLPEWARVQLDALPLARRFHSDGTPKSGKGAGTPPPPAPPIKRDEDLGEFEQS